MSDITCFFVEPVRREGGGTKEIWSREDNDERFEVSSYYELPVGAMFYATWYEDLKDYLGPDGHCLAVVTPGGVWIIDSRASNCGLPDDSVHKCWVRHGTPPMITVDKNGITCVAGGGSIQIGTYHGFLRNGKLTNC